MVISNIVLIGFMGSGKSTIARYLGDTYGMKVVEMDAQIAENEGMSIPDIFAKHGEAYFRDLETGLLKELQLEKNMIISCGGGVPLRDENVVEMKKAGKVVLLDADAKTIFERVKNDRGRPLLAGRNHVDKIAELMRERQRKYEASADMIVSTDNRTVESIGEEIVLRLKEMGEQ